MMGQVKIPNWLFAAIISILLTLVGIVYATLSNDLDKKMNRETAETQYRVIVKTLDEIKAEQRAQSARLQEACEKIARMNHD